MNTMSNFQIEEKQFIINKCNIKYNCFSCVLNNFCNNGQSTHDFLIVELIYRRSSVSL